MDGFKKQEDLLKALKEQFNMFISQQTISDMENGYRCPDKKELEALQKVLPSLPKIEIKDNNKY